MLKPQSIKVYFDFIILYKKILHSVLYKKAEHHFFLILFIFPIPVILSQSQPHALPRRSQWMHYFIFCSNYQVTLNSELHQSDSFYLGDTFSLIYVICAQWCPTHIVFCFSSSCCQFLMIAFLIAPSVFSNVYFYRQK